jgi:hypothetical protein
VGEPEVGRIEAVRYPESGHALLERLQERALGALVTDIKKSKTLNPAPASSTSQHPNSPGAEQRLFPQVLHTQSIRQRSASAQAAWAN